MKTEYDAAKIAGACEKLAIAFGVSAKVLRAQIEQIGDCIKKADGLVKLVRFQKRLLREMSPRQSYISPYAKFDKYHKKRKRWNNR